MKLSSMFSLFLATILLLVTQVSFAQTSGYPDYLDKLSPWASGVTVDKDEGTVSVLFSDLPASACTYVLEVLKNEGAEVYVDGTLIGEIREPSFSPAVPLSYENACDQETGGIDIKAVFDIDSVPPVPSDDPDAPTDDTPNDDDGGIRDAEGHPGIPEDTPVDDDKPNFPGGKGHPGVPPGEGCSLPETNTESRWVSYVSSCPDGQTGEHTWEGRQTRTSNPYCSDSGETVYNWTDWSGTGERRNEVNTCGDVSCTAPDPATDSRWVTQSQACPAGESGSHTWEAKQTRTSAPACNANGGVDYNWGPWAATGDTRGEVNTCAPTNTCTAPDPATQTKWVAQDQACPAGEVGVHTWEYEMSRTSSPACGIDGDVIYNWSAWTPTGQLRNEVNTCTPEVTCTAPDPATQTRWVNDSQACPAGESGSHTWEYEQTRTSAPACTGSGDVVYNWGAWTNTGQTRNDVNTCAPEVTCTAPDPTTQTRWESRSGVCPSGKSGDHTWEAEQTRESAPACNDRGEIIYNWGPWFDTGEIRNEANGCTPRTYERRIEHSAISVTVEVETDSCVANEGFSGELWFDAESLRERTEVSRTRNRWTSACTTKVDRDGDGTAEYSWDIGDYGRILSACTNTDPTDGKLTISGDFYGCEKCPVGSFYDGCVTNGYSGIGRSLPIGAPL